MTTSTPAASREENGGIEVRARTVDEAVARGLVRLGGLSRQEVKIEVVNAGKSGLLGFGAEEAVVRLTRLQPGEQPQSEPESTYTAPEAARTAEAPPHPATAAGVPAEPAAYRAPTDLEPGTPEAGGPAEPAERPRPMPPRPAAARPTHHDAEQPPPGTPAAVPTEADTVVAREVVRTLLGHLGFDDISLDLQDSLLPAPLDDEAALVIGIRGPRTDRLLAQGDRALYALQFIARLILNRHTDAWTNLLLDVNGDRARRLKEIYHMAEQSAQLVEREGRPVSLPPMSPYERRVVHLALKDHGAIATQSIGSGPNRKVTVRRRDQMLPDL